MAKIKPKKKEAAKKAKPKSSSTPKKGPKKATATKKTAPDKKTVKKPSVKIKTVKKGVVKASAKTTVKKPSKVAVKSKISPTPKIKVENIKPVKVEKVPKVVSPKEGRGKVKKFKSEPVPKAEIKTRPVVQKNLAKPVVNNKKPEIVVPKQAKPIQIEVKDRMSIKKQLLLKCLDIQTHIINTAKKAMDDAQQSANEEKNSNEDMSDSFRETMQATRDVYARQVQEGINTLGLLNRIMIKPLEVVKFGAVVVTDFQNYFISAGLGEVKIDDKNFVTVSTLTPLYQILSEKKKGDLFMFLDRKYRILDVF
jgi:hypothetical protein